VQTSEVREDHSCISNNESGNDLGCQYSDAGKKFQAPSVSESYLDSEDSAYGNVYLSLQWALFVLISKQILPVYFLLLKIRHCISFLKPLAFYTFFKNQMSLLNILYVAPLCYKFVRI